MKQDKEIVEAIHDDQLVVFLQNLHIYEEIVNEKYTCKFCKKIITLDNIYTIFPESGSIKIVCDAPACIAHMNSYLTNH